VGPHSTIINTPLGRLYICRLKMRWFTIFASSLLSATALAAKKSVDRFQEFHAKALSSNPVKLDDGLYRRLSSTPRDYTAAILLTAMDARYACQMCREFQPEWDLLARSWIKGDKLGAARVVYGTLDFSDGKDTFMSVCGVGTRVRGRAVDGEVLTART